MTEFKEFNIVVNDINYRAIIINVFNVSNKLYCVYASQYKKKYNIYYGEIVNNNVIPITKDDKVIIDNIVNQGLDFYNDAKIVLDFEVNYYSDNKELINNPVTNYNTQQFINYMYNINYKYQLKEKEENINVEEDVMNNELIEQHSMGFVSFPTVMFILSGIISIISIIFLVSK